MRTPLTAITGQLEVLALRKRSVEEYERTLHSVIEDIHRLNRLANRLLLLAQTETDVAEANFQRCRIDEIIWTAASDVQKFKPDYQVSITFGDSIESDDQLTIWGSEVLLKSVIVNLMENGCKYAEDNCVELHLTAEPRQLLMVVTDRGIGIPDADIGHIFQPFFRGSNVEQRQGHGIGLSLVQRIIALHRGSISISSQVGKGTVVSVRLPLATL